MSPTAKKATKPAAVVTPHRDEDGFWVEEDGLVEMRLELTFVEDAKVRVIPEIAKRIMDGEFDNHDPADIPGIDASDILDTIRVEIETAYEGRPAPPEKTAGIVDGDGGDEGNDDDDDGGDDII